MIGTITLPRPRLAARFGHGEEWTITFGCASGRVPCVVHTSRGPDRIRILSVRKATHRKRYTIDAAE